MGQSLTQARIVAMSMSGGFGIEGIEHPPQPGPSGPPPRSDKRCSATGWKKAAGRGTSGQGDSLELAGSRRKTGLRRTTDRPGLGFRTEARLPTRTHVGRASLQECEHHAAGTVGRHREAQGLAAGFSERALPKTKPSVGARPAFPNAIWNAGADTREATSCALNQRRIRCADCKSIEAPSRWQGICSNGSLFIINSEDAFFGCSANLSPVERGTSYDETEETGRKRPDVICRWERFGPVPPLTNPKGPPQMRARRSRPLSVNGPHSFRPTSMLPVLVAIRRAGADTLEAADGPAAQGSLGENQ